MGESSALSSAALSQRHASLRAPQPALASRAVRFDLTAAKSYDTLVRFGKTSLLDQVQHGYRQGFSKPGEGHVATCALLVLLSTPTGNYQVKLAARSLGRFAVWMDTYVQRLGPFSPDQERQLEALGRTSADLLTEAVPPTNVAGDERPIGTASAGSRN